MSTNELYPDISDLMRAYPNDISAGLVHQLMERYRAHSGEYATDQLRADGRRINACMDRNSLADAEEEVTDAVFNLLVMYLKVKGTNQEIKFLALIRRSEGLWADIHRARRAENASLSG